MIEVCLSLVAGLAFQSPAPPELDPKPAEPPSESSADLLERVRLFDAGLDPVNRLSGVLLVLRSGEILLHEGFGMADWELGVPNQAGTRFCIASITKEMTRLVTWQLLIEGELELSTTLETFLPEFPRAAEITIEHLLRHQAGIPHRVTEPSQTWRPLDAQAVAAAAKGTELAYEPGAQHSYSSAGYTVLARVVELVRGMSFAEVLQKYVFGPAGMTDSVDVDGRELLDRRAKPYVPGRDSLLNAPAQDLSFLAGAGSVTSTAMDVWRFLRCFQSGGFHEDAWSSLQGQGGTHWTGATNGFHAFLDHDPESDTTVVFTGNTFGGGPGQLRAAMPRLLSGEEVLGTARPSSDHSFSAERLSEYVGKYSSRPGTYWKVETRGGELVIGDSVAVPLSETEFWFQGWSTKGQFVRQEGSQSWWLQMGQNPPWPRVE